MKLLEAQNFSLRLVSPSTEREMPQSEVLVNGKPTGQRIAGAVLEAAVQCEDGSVIAFVTDDIPQEDTLRIYMFDPALRMRDWAKLGAMYSTGSFSSLELLPTMIRFRFIGDALWTLKILPQPAWAFPFAGNPVGVHRPFSWRRYFTLHGNPVPEG